MQRSFIAVPLLGTGLNLTYSSEWASGRLDRPAWDETGLASTAGHSTCCKDTTADGVLLGGDGAWRTVKRIDLASGETAIASWDGEMVYVFEASGSHVRTMDGISGMTLLTIGYDDAGRLAAVDGRTRASQSTFGSNALQGAPPRASPARRVPRRTSPSIPPAS